MPNVVGHAYNLRELEVVGFQSQTSPSEKARDPV
jgi:hypothetical protein